MGERFELHVNSDDVLNLLGPTNTLTDASITGGSGSVYLVEERADTNLLSPSLISATFLTVADVSNYVIGDSILVWLDDGSIDELTVDTIGTPSTLTLTSGLAAAAAKGRQVAKQLGATLTLAEFGVTKAAFDTTGEWGYRITKPDTHADLGVGQRVGIIYSFSGGAGVALETRDPAVVVE